MKIKITRRIIIGVLGISTISLIYLSVFFLSIIHQVSNQSEISDTPNPNNPTPNTSNVYKRPAESADQKNQQVPVAIIPSGIPQTNQQTVKTIFTQTSPTFKTNTGKVFPLRTYKTLAPNDPDVTQWWTTSTGLDVAWNIGAGARQTIVAVIDTGFGLKHSEFTNRWTINSGEQGTTAVQSASKLNCTDRLLSLNQSCNLVDDDFDGVVDNESGYTTFENPSQLNCKDQNITIDKSCNLIDDDDNDYMDDVKGWDFANYDPSVQAGEINPYGTGTSHGTEVTGVLAATGNNSIGIAGVNWTTKILPLQAIDDNGYGNTLTVARAIYYAADYGVDVINISLGSDYEDDYIRQAIQYAIDAGTIVVAASGNDGCDCMLYPARYPEVFSVGAQRTDGNPSNFSSYGNNLDIMAPGENIKTTTWTSTNSTSAYASGVAGTSFSTPYVSGLLSLARSHQSNASWGELTNNLLATANHTGLTIDNPVSSLIGSGFAKADNYINRVTTPATPGMRYAFSSTPTLGTLSSNRTYQCYTANDFPTASLFRISSNTSIFYTIDILEYVRALNRGDNTRNLGRTCVGLPGDKPSILRTINLLSELDNIQIHKSQY